MAAAGAPRAQENGGERDGGEAGQDAGLLDAHPLDELLELLLLDVRQKLIVLFFALFVVLLVLFGHLLDDFLKLFNLRLGQGGFLSFFFLFFFYLDSLCRGHCTSF